MQNNRFVIAFSLIVFGSLLAYLVQTSGGDVRVQDIRFVGASGNVLAGHLFIPSTATSESPAPAILAVHGYINSRETQSGFAIEFSRRGYVVLALDQAGHGYSEPPAFDNGFGGPDGLAYLRTLPFVDQEHIGLEGHSMGGWAVQIAAASDPDGYESMVILGSSPGTFGAPPGTSTLPRNVMVVFSLFDEFSSLMWGVDVPADIVSTGKLQTLFGTDEEVVPGKLYGDLEAGTARQLEMPAVTHPGDHLSRDAIGAAITWFDTTLGMEKRLPADQQVWYWKELGTLIALVGFAALVFPLFDRIRRVMDVSTVRAKEIPVPSRAGAIVNVLVGMFLPVVLFFPLQLFAPANALFPQQITNGIVIWAWGTGVLLLIAVLIWIRRGQVSLADIGLPASRVYIVDAIRVAVVCGFILFVVVAGADSLLNLDFRFWVVALKAMSHDQFIMFLIYLPFFAVFFLVLAASLATQMPHMRSLAGQMVLNGIVLSGGFVVLLVIQYAPLLLGGTLAIASQPLLTIVAFQFVPVLFFAGLLLTFCRHRTGELYTGAFLVAILVTWYVVAGTATQAVPFWF